MSAMKDPNNTVAVFLSNHFTWNANGGPEKLRVLDDGSGSAVAFLGRSMTFLSHPGDQHIIWEP
ncbi:MAG: hypothetical protein KF812_07230 [Fimbriimonadaceae bacterium]|nr:hypothetical protein [Fimbriimonadaceae bacterium]